MPDSQRRERIPVTVLTGFLAACRTWAEFWDEVL
jgi:hypothetical protein